MTQPPYEAAPASGSEPQHPHTELPQQPTLHTDEPNGQQPWQPPAPPRLFNGSTKFGFMGMRGIRHPWEIPLVIVGIVCTLGAYAVWGVVVVLMFSMDPQDFNELMASYFGDTIAQVFVIVMVLPIALWIARAVMYGRMRASAIRMSPTQFPEGYRMVAQAAEQFGLRRMPDAYVLLGNGQINAFASGHGFRRFVVVYSDMFEIGGRVRDPEALRFVIGHEVGHLAGGHVAYLRLLFTSIMRNFPLLGPALSRAQEYTADNFGHWHCPQGSLGAMAVLGAGKYLNADVNINELADRAATEKGLWVHIANWTSSHPVTTWRTHALRDRSRPGHLWFRPGTRHTPGAVFRTALPAGSTYSSVYPRPDQALGMLREADARRPQGTLDQFGRFPGVDYQGEPTMREVQSSPPLI